MPLNILWKINQILPSGLNVKSLGIQKKEGESQPTGSTSVDEFAAGLQILQPNDPNHPVRIEAGLHTTLTSASGDKVPTVRME